MSRSRFLCHVDDYDDRVAPARLLILLLVVVLVFWLQACMFGESSCGPLNMNKIENEEVWFS